MRVTDSADLGRAFLVRRGSRILRGVGRESSAGARLFVMGSCVPLEHLTKPRLNLN